MDGESGVGEVGWALWIVLMFWRLVLRVLFALFVFSICRNAAEGRAIVLMPID